METAIFKELVTGNVWQWDKHKTTLWQKSRCSFRSTENFQKIFIQCCVTASRGAIDDLKWRGWLGFDLFCFLDDVEISQNGKFAVFTTTMSGKINSSNFCRKALGFRVALHLKASPFSAFDFVVVVITNWVEKILLSFLTETSSYITAGKRQNG